MTTVLPNQPSAPEAQGISSQGIFSQGVSSQGISSHCPYCALQCAMTLTPNASGSRLPLTVTGRDFPTNRGGLCRKGWTSAELLSTPGRLLTPLIRNEDGELKPASWNRALGVIAHRLRAIQARHGRDAVGVFGGGGLTNEKAYALGKFARIALGTSRIDYNGRFCMSSAAAAANRAFGVDRGLPFPVADLDNARCVLLLGSNPADTMPPFVQHLTAAQSAGSLIVVDPRVSSTALLTASTNGLHLAPTPGTDLALLLGITYVVIHENLADESYLTDRTQGFDAVIRSVAPWWPEQTEKVTGVPVAKIRQAAHLLASRRSIDGSGGTYIITGRGVEQHADGTDTVTAAINLALCLGLPGRPGNGYGTLTGQGNGQGGREHGQKADQLPGYRKITDPAARKHVAAVWNVPESSIPGAGLPAVELLRSLGKPGGVRALLVHGSNPVVSAPNVGAVREGLASLDLLVVSDLVMSETAAMADVVLPVTQWAEEDGTMTTLEGRVVRRRQAVMAPDGVRSELWIMHRLADILGTPEGFPVSAAAVFDELRRASAGGIADYSGIDDAALDSPDGAFWPYPTGSTGTPRLFRRTFATTNGLANLVAVRYRGAVDALSPASDVYLVTGRLLGHYQSGAQTRRVAELVAADPEPRLQINPTTAVRLGLRDSQLVSVTSARGTVRARTQCDGGIRRDTVFLPFHFAGDVSVNLTTSDATDPISGMPEFKVAAVTIASISDDEQGDHR